MLLLNRKKDQMKKTIGLAIVVLVGAHLAAGALICSKACRCQSSGFPQMIKKAKRTVVGLVKEII